MPKTTIILEYDDKSTIEIDVETSIVDEAPILEYKKEFFVFSSWTSNTLGKPKFVKVRQPAFVG
jgi:hypothetical protein